MHALPLGRLMSARGSSGRRELARRRFLRFEPLEPRRLLTVDLVSVTPLPAPLVAGSDYSSNPDVNGNGRYIAFQSHADDLVRGVADTNGTQDVFVRDVVSGVTTLISVNAEGTDSGACSGISCFGSTTAGSFNPAISDDGRYVAFVSEATNLVKGVVVDITPNVFVRDRDADEDGVFDETGTGETLTTLLSLGIDGTAAGVVGGSGASTRPVISGDGKFVVFVSDAADMSVDVPSIVDTNGSGRDVYRASVAGGAVTRINIDGTGSGTGFGSGSHFDLSTNTRGSLVAFATTNSGLVTTATGSVDDTNGGVFDVFVGIGNTPVELISVNSAGTGTGDGASREPVLSGNGRHVAFFSRAANLVAGVTDTNFVEDVFVRDLKTGRTTLVSQSRAGSGTLMTGDGASPPSTLLDSEITAGPALSDDGRFIVFRSSAEDLLDPTLGVVDTNGVSDIFVLDRDPDRDGRFDEPGETEMILVSVNSAGTASTGHGGLGPGSAGSFAPAISGDGRFVAFASTGVDLVPGASGTNVFMRDLVTGITSLVSTTVSGDAGGVGGTTPPTRLVDISEDGSRVAFQSDRDAADLDPTVTDPPDGSPTSFGDLDVFAGTPPTDIVLTRNFASGSTTHYQAFRVRFEESAPFEVGFYDSADRIFDAGDGLLGTAPVTDPDDLTVDGNRIITSTIGAGPSELALPGIAASDSLEDYFILAVGDHLDMITEFDGDPFNEDNTSALRGLYHVPGGPLFVHGGAAGETLTASSDGTTLAFGFGSLSAPYTYDVADVTEVRVRAHEGDDVITGSDLIDVFFGGEGNDRLDGGAGDDVLDGGPGKDTILGGPGADLIFDGCGDDLVDAGPDDDVVMSTPCSDDIFDDGGGNDTLDFSLDDQEITLDLDSTAIQTVDATLSTIQLVGQWENFVGSPLGNHLTLRPLPAARVVLGGAGEDQLLLDAGGHSVIDDGTKFSFPDSGMGDITYSGFEHIRVVNAAARTMDDGDVGYSAPGFTRQFDPQFPQGFNGDIEYSEANSGNTATWVFENLAPGSYAVSATWTSAPDRAGSAPFSIRDGDVTGTIVGGSRVNQEMAPNEFADEGVSWQNLDVVTITGNQLTVELTDIGADLGADDAFEFVIADAVRIEPISSTLIIDDGEPNFTSPGAGVDGIGAFGDLTTTQAAGAGSSGGVWSCTQAPCLDQVPPGRYLVSATWSGFVAGATAGAVFTVTSGANSFAAGVNQVLAPNDFNEAGIDWERLGVIDITAGNGFQVELTGASGFLLADAIRIAPAPRLELIDPLGSIVPNGGDVDLGETAINTDTGQANELDRFTIRNTGDAELQVSNLAVGGTGYSLLDPGVSVLPPGGSTQFVIEFTGPQEGLFAANVTLDVTDFGNSPFAFDATTIIVDDTTPPTVEIVSPDDSAVFIEGTTIEFEVEANDDIQVRRVEFLIDDQVVFSSVESRFTFPFDSAPSAGNRTMIEAVAQVVDLAGNVGVSQTVTLELLPDQPPTIQLVSPYDGDGVIAGSTIRVQVDAEDDVAIRRVEFRVDGALQLTQVFEPFVGEVQIPSAAGDHSVEACATDTLGQVTCQTATVTAFTRPLIDFSSIVVAADAGQPPVVRIFQAGGTELFRFFAYDPGFLGGVRVATGDVTGDGTPDIITSAGPGGGPHVKVFDGTTGGLIRSFFAFDGFVGGVTVAVGDVSGDGVVDIITGAGPGVPGGHVKVFDGVDNALVASFLAFPGFAGGVNVAAGDVNGDGQDDIITGAGAGGGPHVRVFDGHSAGQLPPNGSVPPGALVHDFFPFDPNLTGGVFVGAGDVNNDGFADIITGPGPGIAEHVKVFSGIGQAELGSFFAFEPSFRGGVRVGAADVDGDGIDDIITGAGPGGGPRVKVFDGTNLGAAGELDSFFAFDPAFNGGVFVSSVVQSQIDVVNLPPSGGTYEALVENNELVVRQQGGAELFRGPADDHRKVRVNGAPNANDLLIMTLLGSAKPFVFDGGVGGFDEVRLARRTPPTQVEYLNVVFQQVYVTSFSTDRSARPEDFELLAVDLEPIDDQLDVLHRVFTFGADGNQIVFDTGDDPGDTILRLNSQNSEVVDFEQPAESLLLELGPGDDTLSVGFEILPQIDGQGGTNRLNFLGAGQTLDLTIIDDAEFRRIDEIDISGSGANGLVIDAVEVLNLSDTSDTLRVIAGPDDTVLIGSGWLVTGSTTIDGKFFRILEQTVPQQGTARLLLNGPRNWQNPVNHHDVNNDGVAVEPVGDILRLINEINNRTLIDATGRLPVEPSGGSFSYLDVNGDGFLTPAGDVLPQANERNRQNSGGEGELPLVGQPFFAGSVVGQAPFRGDFGTLPELRATADGLQAVPQVLRGGQNQPAWQRLAARRLGEVAARERLFARHDDQDLLAPQTEWDSVLDTLATEHPYVRVRSASS